jgi:hypothetical protein
VSQVHSLKIKFFCLLICAQPGLLVTNIYITTNLTNVTFTKRWSYVEIIIRKSFFDIFCSTVQRCRRISCLFKNAKNKMNKNWKYERCWDVSQIKSSHFLCTAMLPTHQNKHRAQIMRISSSSFFVETWWSSLLLTLRELLSHSMLQRSSWQATKEIHHSMWNPKVHYHVHKSPSTDLSWARLIQFTPYFLMITLPLMPRSFKWSSCYFLCRKSKYSPQHPVLKHAQSMFAS